MSWRLRVVCEGGLCSIREVHQDGTLSDPVAPVGESIGELSNHLMALIAAFRLPMLEVQDGRLRQVSE